MNHNLTIGINLNNRTLTNNIPDNTTVSELKYIAKVNDDNYIAENLDNGVSKGYFHYLENGEDVNVIFYSSDGTNISNFTLPENFGTITQIDDTSVFYEYITRVSHEKVYVTDEDMNKRESLDIDGIKTEVENQVRGYGVPVNSIIGFDGNTIPAGYEEVDGFDNYSTTETKIGTWINGKTLYRQVFEVGLLGETFKNRNFDFAGNFEIITKCDGFLYKNNGSCRKEYYDTDNSRLSFSAETSQGNLTLWVHRGNQLYWSDWYGVIIIEYTKITD